MSSQELFKNQPAHEEDGDDGEGGQDVRGVH